VSTKTRTAE